MRLTKMSIFFIIIFINEVISTPLDSKFKTKKTTLSSSNAVQKRNDVIYPPLVNSFSSLILPRNNITVNQSAEYERRRDAAKLFIVEILKSIKNVTPLEIRNRIEKYLKEDESGHRNKSTSNNNQNGVAELATTYLGNSNNNNYYNDTNGDDNNFSTTLNNNDARGFNGKLLRNSKFYGDAIAAPGPSGDDDDDDSFEEIRRDFNELLQKEIKRLESFDRRRRRQDNEDDEAEEDDESGPSGLAGLFATLSGGEEGSDVGALVGALSTLITNLFGPGGLDVASVLSTGTSLIAGLLSGDENFGKVVGGYLTTAVDGFAGGGGAELNGLFFGNLVGSLLAGLSADPEESSEEELPPKPGIFIQNFFQGYKAAHRKGEAEEESKGSDSFGFIKHIVQAIAGGSTSVIVKGSVGSSGGSSQGSADASAGSSGHHPPTDGDGDGNAEELRKLK